ncbi:MAG: Cytidylate kinase [Gammaproteobacteria bacterium]|nr:Cytidylate kinase [Gammaproteobacteria bacterium]
MNNPVPVLTLDGPSGSGKGAVGQLCAQKLGWHYLDSGAIYRALAYVVRQAGLDAGDVEAVVQRAEDLKMECLPNPPESAVIMVNGENVDDRVRNEEMGRLASRLASIPAVRAALLRVQRRARQAPGLVADGRDMGTVVFPDAHRKFFLTAGAGVRAERRYKQLKVKGFDGSLAALFEAIQERDTRDAQRAVSPLKPAEDATMLDTSDMSIDEVVSRVLDRVIH